MNSLWILAVIAFLVLWLLAYIVAVILRASQGTKKSNHNHPPIAEPDEDKLKR